MLSLFAWWHEFSNSLPNVFPALLSKPSEFHHYLLQNFQSLRLHDFAAAILADVLITVG